MSRTNALSHELTAFLGDQLRTLAEGSGFSITTDGPDLVVVGGDGHESRNATASILEDDDPRPAEERAATAARAVLGHVQDAIARSTGRPWPGEGTGLPLPGAAVEDGSLIAWFGDRDAPAWRSDTLPLPA